MFLELAVVILSLALIILVFLLLRQKQQKAIKSEVKEIQPEPTLQEQQLTSLSSQLVNSHQEIQKLKELILTTFTDHKAS